MPVKSTLAAAILPAALLLSCGAEAQTVSNPFDPFNPFPDPITKGSVHVRLEEVANGLTSPNLLTYANDGSGRLFVADQNGRVRLVKNGQLQATPFLDVSSRLVTLNAQYDERGLLGLAFHPDFATVGSAGYGKLYTYTSERRTVSGVTIPADFTVSSPSFNHQSVVAEWSVDPQNPDAVDPTTRRELMRIDQPQSNHNGGMLAFGPDDLLYISLGDGGSANDVGNGHGTIGNGQDPSNVLGSILRIDPTGTNSANGKYGVPGDNPFVTDPAKVDEIYAYGLRNTWRFSFDRATGALVAADVGQNTVEEVNLITAGGNYGWNLKEGQFRFNPANGEITNDLSGLPANLIDPVLQYDHDEGLSVTGGFVYRGSAIPELEGKYVFGDWGSFGFPTGRLFAGDMAAGTIEELNVDNLNLSLWILGFGEDADGELYVLGSSQRGPTGTTGQVFKLAPVPVPAGVWLFGSALLLVGGKLRRQRGAG
jgi:glucose/arabinose dehydrogenase